MRKKLKEQNSTYSNSPSAQEEVCFNIWTQRKNTAASNRFRGILRTLSNIYGGILCGNSQQLLVVSYFCKNIIIDVWKGVKDTSGLYGKFRKIKYWPRKQCSIRSQTWKTVLWCNTFWKTRTFHENLVSSRYWNIVYYVCW